MAFIEKLTMGAMLALFATGCPSNNTEDTEDTEEEEDTEDEGPVYLQPQVVSTVAAFGYDGEDDQAIAATIATDEGDAVLNPTLLIFLYEFTGSAIGAEVCEIRITQTGPFPASTTFGSAEMTTGFIIDPTSADATLTHNCDGVLDPAVWGDDIQATLEGFDYGFALTGEIDEANGSETDANAAEAWKLNVDDNPEILGDWFTDWAPYIVGGAPYWSLLGGPIIIGGEPICVARGTQLDDANREIAGQYVTSSDVLAAEGPATGLYESGCGFVAIFDSVITPTPPAEEAHGPVAAPRVMPLPSPMPRVLPAR